MSSESIALVGVEGAVERRSAILAPTGSPRSITSGSAFCTSCMRCLFLVIGGIEATIMRIQLIVPNNHFVSPQVFNRMFTMHGTTMIFFVAMPILFGFGNYLVPLMIGARDMAFPRLNAFSFWLTAFGGLLLYFSFVGGDGLYGAGTRPTWAGSPTRRSRRKRSPSATAPTSGRSAFWSRASAASATAVNFITTIFCMRCPGMTLGKNAAVRWMNLVMAGMVIFAVHPAHRRANHAVLRPLSWVRISSTRRPAAPQCCGCISSGFSATPRSTSWSFPAFAFISEIVPVFSRKADFRLSGDGRGDGWHRLRQHERLGSSHVHGGHEFLCATPSSRSSTMAVGVPTGIKIFNWLATMWGGKILFKTPMLFCIAFLFQFLIAGLTGIMLSCGAVQLAAQRLVLCGRALSLRDRRRDSLLRSSRLSTTGSRRSTGTMYNETLGKCALLALRHRLPSDVRFHAYPRAARACRAASIRTSPGAAGTSGT